MIPHDGRRKPLVVSNNVARDAAFHAWFAGFPDVDAEERRQFEAAVAADPRFGSTPAERLRWLAAARRITRGFQLAALAIYAWGLLYPHPYHLVIAVLIAVPWVVLLAVGASRGLCGIDGKGGRAGLLAAFVLPGALLALRAFLDLNMTDWHQAVALGIAGGIGLAVLAMVLDAGLRRRWRFGLFIAVVVSAYGYGAVVEVNALLDRSPSSHFSGVVAGKRLIPAQIPLRSLRLEPWGPLTEPGEVLVPQALYNAVQTGDTVCIALHPGALAIPWFTVRSCT